MPHFGLSVQAQVAAKYLRKWFSKVNSHAFFYVSPVRFEVRQPWWSTTNILKNININWNAKSNPKKAAYKFIYHIIMHSDGLICSVCACSLFNITHNVLGHAHTSCYAIHTYIVQLQVNGIYIQMMFLISCIVWFVWGLAKKYAHSNCKKSRQWWPIEDHNRSTT